MSQFAPNIIKTLEQRDRAGINAIRDYSHIKSLPEIWPIAAERYGHQLAMDDPHNQPSAQLTYQQLWDNIRQFAAGLQALGLSPQAHVALFADNSHRWFIADQGVMAAGGIDAVRSSQAETEELRYIAEHSDSTVLILQDVKLWQRLRDRIENLPIQVIVLLSDETAPEGDGPKIVNYTQVLTLGNQHAWTPVEVEANSLDTTLHLWNHR
ncbi:MAG: AMP-binding protein [Leptolyngbya sp. SIO1D8]|nr:AMP-binding protein [Leptolyngbya sp. SIO1D8]